jgi:hypothetical protein
MSQNRAMLARASNRECGTQSEEDWALELIIVSGPDTMRYVATAAMSLVLLVMRQRKQK